ncbi:alpha/beta hydrolase [Vibrio sp. 10N.261.51.F12]|uniref:alpha/beta hydrolase n=1 Tax=Vibrio sp. 10N.261.51.F12 TaxID=3229679 RepID=UPI0035501B96
MILVKWLSTLLSILLYTVLISGCSNRVIDANPQMYERSYSLSPYRQATFSLYATETRDWLSTYRVFHGAGFDREMDAVSPYKLVPEVANGQGILLVHGLGDSPYSFVDIAPYLSAQGYLVHVMLLPGHGSRPADLMNPTYDDWVESVAHQVDLLRQEVDSVWLGGFSTGTNLVTSYAADRADINGLLLFSPAFKPKDPLAGLAGFASYFVDWVSVEKEQNYSRYDSLAMHGAALYYQSAVDVQKKLNADPLDVPAILMLAESDELVDAKGIYDLFKVRFSHQESELIWFGDRSYSDPRFVKFPMKLPEFYIQSGSHISVLYSASNPLYGRQGLMRQCGGSQEGEVYKVDCPKMPTLSHAAWDLFEDDTINARLSWNPYFEQTMQRVLSFMQRVTVKN